jgi:hypothetical protein
MSTFKNKQWANKKSSLDFLLLFDQAKSKKFKYYDRKSRIDSTQIAPQKKN